MTGCAILVLAAGAASRMRGGDKLLEEIADQPLLRIMLERALCVATGPVLCTLPAPYHPRMRCLDGLRVTPVIVRDAEEGMGDSIRAGVAAMPADCAAVMILPADMPDLSAHDLQIMVQAQQDTPDLILRAVDENGAFGHPVVFPVVYAPQLQALQGDRGARDLLQAHAEAVRAVALPALHATTDLDTPEAWAAWRGNKPS